MSILVEVFQPSMGNLSSGFFQTMGLAFMFIGIPTSISYFLLG
jgi:hypothetical protein